MDKCISCNTQTDKYKCPTCNAPYCSVDCCRSHKNTPCQLATACTDHQPLDEPTTISTPTAADTIYSYDMVPPDKLDLLSDNEALRNLLYNPHLRRFLTEVDSAKDAWRAMKVAMLEPLFIEFADECLRVVEPLPEDDT